MFSATRNPRPIFCSPTSFYILHSSTTFHGKFSSRAYLLFLHADICKSVVYAHTVAGITRLRLEKVDPCEFCILWHGLVLLSLEWCLGTASNLVPAPSVFLAPRAPVPSLMRTLIMRSAQLYSAVSRTRAKIHMPCGITYLYINDIYDLPLRQSGTYCMCVCTYIYGSGV